MEIGDGELFATRISSPSPISMLRHVCYCPDSGGERLTIQDVLSRGGELLATETDRG